MSPADDGLHNRLSTSLEEVGGATVLKVCGAVDLTAIEDFRKALLEALELAVAREDGPPRLKVDLTRCEAINSRGLWAVLSVAEEFQNTGGECIRVVEATDERVRHMFRAASGDHGLLIYADLPAALVET